jgi:hypothetical protein
MDRLGPSGTQSRSVKRFLSERELEQVIGEIYDNEGSEVDWSDSDVEEEEEASVPISMSSDSSDSDAELGTRVDQSSGLPPESCLWPYSRSHCLRIRSNWQSATQ